MASPATTTASSTTVSSTTADVPSNPPPQRRAIMRSVTGTIGSDPNHVSLSPLLTDGLRGMGGAHRAFCMPVFIVASF